MSTLKASSRRLGATITSSKNSWMRACQWLFDGAVNYCGNFSGEEVLARAWVRAPLNAAAVRVLGTPRTCPVLGRLLAQAGLHSIINGGVVRANRKTPHGDSVVSHAARLRRCRCRLPTDLCHGAFDELPRVFEIEFLDPAGAYSEIKAKISPVVTMALA